MGNISLLDVVILLISYSFLAYKVIIFNLVLVFIKKRIRVKYFYFIIMIT